MFRQFINLIGLFYNLARRNHSIIVLMACEHITCYTKRNESRTVSLYERKKALLITETFSQFTVTPYI